MLSVSAAAALAVEQILSIYAFMRGYGGDWGYYSIKVLYSSLSLETCLNTVAGVLLDFRSFRVVFYSNFFHF